MLRLTLTKFNIVRTSKISQTKFLQPSRSFQTDQPKSKFAFPRILGDQKAEVEFYKQQSKITADQGLSQAKEWNNNQFVGRTIEVLTNPKFANSSVFYLDGRLARTTQYLLNEGVDRRMLMPVSYDKLAYAEFKYLEIPNALHGYVDILLGKDGPGDLGQFASVWLDYCGTFSGNKTRRINPQSDIRKLLTNHLVPDSYLAMTFSLRSEKKDPVKELGKLLYEFDYSDKNIRSVNYGRMIFIHTTLVRK